MGKRLDTSPAQPSWRSSPTSAIPANLCSPHLPLSVQHRVSANRSEMESPKRKRARLACQPCRERKRKCDGRDPPCSTCSQWGYECSYPVRQSSSTSQTPALASPRPPSVASGPLRFDVVTPTTCATPDTAASAHDGLRRRVEANSGATTVRRLGLKMDPTRAPRLNLFGWNIGARQLSSAIPAATALQITEITSLDHMKVSGFSFEVD